MGEHLAALSDDFRGLDWIRLLGLSMGSLLIGFSLAVMVEARKFRMPPWHVWAIAVSYIILIATLMAEVAERWGQALGWRSYVALVAFAFGIYSQWLMYRAYHYAARLRRHEKRAIVEGNRLMGEVFRRTKDEPREDAVERRDK